MIRIFYSIAATCSSGPGKASKGDVALRGFCYIQSLNVASASHPVDDAFTWDP